MSRNGNEGRFGPFPFPFPKKHFHFQYFHFQTISISTSTIWHLNLPPKMQPTTLKRQESTFLAKLSRFAIEKISNEFPMWEILKPMFGNGSGLEVEMEMVWKWPIPTISISTISISGNLSIFSKMLTR